MKRVLFAIIGILLISSTGSSQSLNPRELKQEIRSYRSANEHKIINEYREFLSIPNVSRDRENIRRNAAEYTFEIGPGLNKNIIADLLKLNNPQELLGKTDDSGLQFRSFKVSVRKAVEEGPEIPDRYFLDQNYPNPFNPETMIRFGLPNSGSVTLKIYNILGQEVRTVVDGFRNAGIHTVKWDGRNNTGQRVATGVYIYRLITSESMTVKKMIMIR
ncbi:FlgD immunoglobulin-like domain containing protein [candidate division KSB1 bacterium]